MLFKKSIIFCIAGLTIAASPTQTCAEHREGIEGKIGDILKVRGQVRLRGDFVENQNLSDFAFSLDSHDEQILSRTRLSLSLEPIKQIKGFIQGQFYSRQDHNDYSKASLYQAYIEVLDAENSRVSLKAGRQDFCYGSSFFLGTNDFYDGLTWDGAKVKILPKDDFWIDLIGARYVKLDKNTSDSEPALYGAYSSYKPAKDTDIDLYFFYHKGGFKFFHTDLPDSPRWFTLGTRIAGKIKGQFDYELEPLYQFGRIDNPERASHDAVSAYGGHAEAGYTFDSGYKPRLFIGYAFGEGDNDASDKKYREFHGNIYNDNYLVGDTSLIPDLSGITIGDTRASGMRILLAGLSIDPHPKINLNLDYHYFKADRTPAGVSRKLGSEIDLIITYKLWKDLNIIASANRFFTGKFFEDVTGSGKDVKYFYIQTQIEF